MAAWKAIVSASSCVRRRRRARASSRRRRRTTICWSTTMRVFMCAAGTCGLCGWAISDTPEAQNRGSCLGARDLLAELGRELAMNGR